MSFSITAKNPPRILKTGGKRFFSFQYNLFRKPSQAISPAEALSGENGRIATRPEQEKDLQPMQSLRQRTGTASKVP